MEVILYGIMPFSQYGMGGSDMKAFEIEAGGEIATGGEAEEPSGHTSRITHGYHPFALF